MPDTFGQRLVAASVPIAVVTFAWASFEQGAELRPYGAVALLSLMAAIPPLLSIRLVVGAGMVTALLVTLGGGTRVEIGQIVERGLKDIYTAVPPLLPSAHHELHVLIVLTVAAFCVVLAALAGQRPFLAAAVTAAGVGWPTTVEPARNTVAMGILGLFGALWPLVVRDGRARGTLVPGVAASLLVVGAASVLVAAGAKPSVAALDWQSWDLFGESQAGRTVALVWSSNYDGIDFPSHRTTVLRIGAPDRALFWRATTLDLFTNDRWLEGLYVRDVAGADRLLPADDLLPHRASRASGWVRQEVDVRALIDDHVIAAAQPMRLAGGAGQQVQYDEGGVMRARGGRAGMRRYTVWSYAPNPTPAALDRLPPHYPASLERDVDIGGTVVPWYGTPGRVAVIRSVFRDDRYQQIWPYQPIWERARKLTARARSPFEATVAIERWLRASGGFQYDEHPPLVSGEPPLVGFVTVTKLGYCQQFAGTMALMLRYLGIPARVAVGFMSGTWQDGIWTVTDHDAHAWVEAWFPGYGWLSFDPTPGRGTLSAAYTNASDSADAVRALGTGRFLGLRATPPSPSVARVTTAESTRSRKGALILLVPLAAVAALLLALAAAKTGRLLLRSRDPDPRRRASAARAELVGFIRDQGVDVAPSAPVAELTAELRRLGVAGEGFSFAFSRARYGPPGQAAAAADETRLELRRLRTRLRGRLGPGRRLRGFLRLRSLRHA